MFRVVAGLPTPARAATRIRLSRISPHSGIFQQKQQHPRKQISHFSSNSNPCAAASKKIEATQKWFERVVIGEKLCPFASPLLKQEGLLRIVSSSASNIQEAIYDVQKEVYELVGDTDARHETTLVVLDGYDHQAEKKSTFVDDYREFVRLSWELQAEAVGDVYQEKVQLVLFHPRATHQTYASSVEDDDDDGAAADYTIRSPYPTIHLLREEDVLKAVPGPTTGFERSKTL